MIWCSAWLLSCSKVSGEADQSSSEFGSAPSGMFASSSAPKTDEDSKAALWKMPLSSTKLLLEEATEAGVRAEARPTSVEG